MAISLKHYPEMTIKGLLPRDVWVWTPPEYETQPHRQFPVIYMHDGQNLFVPEKSYTHVTWGVAETITKLSRWGFIQPAIVVGVDNTENRFGDYLPLRPYETPEDQAFLESLIEDVKEEFGQTDWVADQYLQLMVEVIKPRVDQDFRTLTGAEHTFVMGSSMGGLISLYALVAYPQVFGGAGCLSTHWPVMKDFMCAYLQEKLPSAGAHKLYYDYGTEGLDAEYEPYQQAVDALMLDKGYQHGVDWITRRYPSADHHERAWRARLHIALRFFLGIN